MNHKREKWKKVELTKECKAILTLLIREVQDCKTDEELNALLKSWIDANDLHPEKVEQWLGREKGGGSNG